jgi:hypothetical protein
MTIHSKKIENILKLDLRDRYEYFVRKVADFEILWGLYEEGWVVGDSQGTTALPVWPEKEFAAICAAREWAGSIPKEIPLADFLQKWLPGMASDGRHCWVFPSLTDRGYLIDPMVLKKDLEGELEQYE